MHSVAHKVPSNARFTRKSQHDILKTKKIVGLQDSENYMEMNYPGNSPSFQKVRQQDPLPERYLKELNDLPRINKG